MVFHRSLNESNSPQVSRTLLRVLADFDNTVVWMFPILPLISSTASSFCKLLGTVSSTPTTIGISIIIIIIIIIIKIFVRCEETKLSIN